jgi:transketolase
VRRAFSNTLVRVAEENDRVIFLTGDLGFQVFDEFVEKFPGRYVNVGVAEAQLVDCAAGLALEGWRPIVYSIASFMTGRAFEQIRVMISYHNLPVMVVGAGGGYTYGDSGVTHHAKEDLGLMSLLPNMTVVAPGDPNEVEAIMPQLLAQDGPSYFRIGRFGETAFESDAPIIVGRARRLRDGDQVAIITTGGQAVQALEAWDLLSATSEAPQVVHMHTAKPLDTAALDALPNNVHTILVVEEHGPTGGLAASVAEWSARRPTPIRVTRLGPDDGLVFGNPTQAEIRSRHGYDPESIAAACRDARISS